MENSFSPAQTAINTALTDLLAASNCTGGRLQVQYTAGRGLFSLSGRLRDGGREVLLWTLTSGIKRLVAHYLDEEQPDTQALTIDLDLQQPSCTYTCTSAAQLAQQQAKEAASEQQAQQARQQQHQDWLRTHLAREPYGQELAGLVAAALLAGRPFNYAHRDYCGMGFDVADHQLRYGSVWDGDLLHPERTFQHRRDFVAWLARQSDLSLAELNHPEPWVRNNQVVSRARLEEFTRNYGAT